jgi:hypothetical protein
MTGQAGEGGEAAVLAEIEGAVAAFKPQQGAEALESLRGEIKALRGVRAFAPRIDVQRAAALAHSVALRDAKPERRAVFERLEAGGFYDLATLERLPRLSLAVWFARRQQLMHRALSSEARVPEDAMREARALRARMARVLGYWLDDRPAIVNELAFVREGAGHVDLAGDLTRLADLYERDDVRALIARDVRHYRPGDAADARRLADAVFVGLGLRSERDARRWTLLAHGAFRLLTLAYDEHRRSGVYAFGRREDVGRTYPALVTAARAPAAKGRGRRRAEGDAEGGDG